MAAKHDHEPKAQECEHETKHCAHCDVVYCTKCSKEWGNDNGQLVRKLDKPFPWPGGPDHGIMLCIAESARMTEVHAHG